MLYAGIDLHKRSAHIVVTDRDGLKVGDKNMSCDPTLIRKFFSKYEEPMEAVVEATTNWPWLVRQLRADGINPHLAHPLRVKAIASAKIKNDRIDATVLAHLLRSNLIPESYMASEAEQQARELIRFRHRLVKEQTRLKNTIHTLLAKQNLVSPVSDLYGINGREWLDKVTSSLTTTERLVVSTSLAHLGEIQQHLKELMSAIKLAYEADPQAQLIQSIPGFGPYTALVVSMECGDITRFTSDKQLTAYVGIIPSTHASGGNIRHGGLTKTGNPYVRWVLTQAVYRAIRIDPYLKYQHQRLTERIGNKKATIAIARRLLVSTYYMITRSQHYVFREVPN